MNDTYAVFLILVEEKKLNEEWRYSAKNVVFKFWNSINIYAILFYCKFSYD